MIPSHIARHRLQNQRITGTGFDTPSGVVTRLGAIQGQDYAGAKWSIGLRLPKATDVDVERAIADKTIIRTWLMRGTLHIVAAADIHWMRALLSPRLIEGSSGRHRQLELDGGTFSRSERLFARALGGGNRLTRDEMYQVLEKAGISTVGQRGYHILWRTAQEGLICFGPMNGKQQTFVWLDEWIPKTTIIARDQALAGLAGRYFSSRGPATLQDFVWWSGLKVMDARAGLDAVASHLISEKADGNTYWLPRNMPVRRDRSSTAFLLPGFDEYLLGYKDRAAVLDPTHSPKVCPVGNGVFRPTIVINGRIVGTWSRSFRKDGVDVGLRTFRTLTEAEERIVAGAMSRYGKFLGIPLAGCGVQTGRRVTSQF